MTCATPPDHQARATRRTTQAWSIILWWEMLRLPFNVALALAGATSLIVVHGVAEPFAAPGEDVIEPALLWVLAALYALAANLCYTLGWLSELVWSGGDPTRTRPYRMRVFFLGLIGSFILTLSPALIAGAIWLFVRGG